MPQPSAASSLDTPELAPEAPSLGRRALSGLSVRPGFAIFIPGECLKVDSKLWSEEQRTGGLWLKGVYLSASEEEEAISDAQREGRVAAVGIYTIKKSLHAIADSILAADPEAEGGQRRSPGSWRPIPSLDRRAYWEELGPQGRAFFVQAYQLAHTPSEQAREVALKSFCTIS